MEKLSYKISMLDHNQRIDKYLKKQLPNAPLNFIYRLFRLKDVRVNGVRINEAYILKDQDEVTLFLTAAQKNDFIVPYDFNPSTLKSPILYEDERILVVNKVRGLLIHSDINEQVETLTNQVLTYLSGKNEFDGKERGYIPSPIGRIDKNTSGIVVFAKTLLVNQQLSQALANGEVDRVYLALIHGKVDTKGTLNYALSKESNGRGLVNVDDEGKESITQYKKLKEFDGYSYVEIKLETGRSNQIRVHFAHIGHPLVGDHKYGSHDGFSTLCLHHHKLRFLNLEGDLQYISKLQLSAPLPGDIEQIIKEIEG